MIRLAVDAMGGDFAPHEILKGVKIALDNFNDIEVILFGDEKIIKEEFANHPRVKIVHTDDFLDMGVQDPIKAFRTNQNYSLFLAMKAVKDNEADAIISAGPTQALVVGGHFILRRIKGMKRVAITPFLPDFSGRTRILLDSGANVEFRPEHILDFAVVATIIAKSYLKIDQPKVGLVNIGSEEGKGREEDIQAYNLLKDNDYVNFYGNVEPKDALSADVDILVTDGFTGNILMKSYEGAVDGFGRALKDGINKSFKAKLGALLMKNVFKDIKSNTNADHVGGAILVGVNGILIKAHGSSNSFAFSNAIRQARLMAKEDIITKISEAIEDIHKDE